MELDATVTIGNLLTMGAGLFTVLTVLIAFIGSKYFPSKREVEALRVHVDEQIASARQDVHNAVGRIEVFWTTHQTQTTAWATERHQTLTANIDRLERSIHETLQEIKVIRTDASHGASEAEKAMLVARANEKVIDTGIGRLENMVAVLLQQRTRVSDNKEG